MRWGCSTYRGHKVVLVSHLLLSIIHFRVITCIIHEPNQPQVPLWTHFPKPTTWTILPHCNRSIKSSVPVQQIFDSQLIIIDTRSRRPLYLLVYLAKIKAALWKKKPFSFWRRLKFLLKKKHHWRTDISQVRTAFQLCMGVMTLPAWQIFLIC